MNRFQYLVLGVLSTASLSLFASSEVAEAPDGRKIEAVRAICESLSKTASTSHSHDDQRECGKFPKKEQSLCGCVRLISSKDIGHHGYTISKPGNYTLIENIDFEAHGINQSAIIIESDNVVLDLCNHYITQINESAGAVGISINGQENVVVENGTVSNFFTAGIRVNSDSRYITLRNLNAFRNGRNNDPVLDVGGGIVITSALPDAVTNDILIENVNASENSLAGLILSGVTDVLVVHSKFNNNTTDVTGFGTNSWGVLATAFFVDPQSPSFLPVDNLTFVESEMNGNTSTGTAIGIEVLSVPAFGFAVNHNVSILRCTANDNHGGGSATAANEGEGFVIAGTENFVVRDCVAKRNGTLATAPSGTPGFFASVGFGVPFACNNGLFENCVAEGNSGAGDVSAGFRISRSSNIVVNNCVSQGNINTSTGEAWGFTTDVNLGNDIGAFGPPVNRNYVFTNNVAESNIANSNFGGGFKFTSVVNSTLSDNRSVTNGSSGAGNGYGILVGNPPCCATATCCTTDPVVCDSPSGCLPFSTCCPTSHNIINNNEVIGNTQFGIFDDLIGASNNAYYANVARSNVVNYALPPGTPIRLWPLPAFPLPVDNNGLLDSQLDNISITP